MNKRILVIDDDDFFAIHLERLLGETFDISHEWNGPSGIGKAIKLQPDIILLDVEMPEMDGYQVCAQLKDEEKTRDIPVIFISSHAETEDRLRGFDAGGEDYMAKPPVPAELKHKISVVLRNRQVNEELATRADSASKVAMAAMVSAGDAGLLLNFSREIATYTGFVQIAETCLGLLSGQNLDASVQLRSKQGVISRNQQGFCSPLEESVLQTMGTCGRIVDLGKRSAFNFERVTIIVNNMPRENPDNDGRLKDTVVMVAEIVDIHLSTLEITFEAIGRGDTLLELLHKNATTLREIEQRFQFQRSESSEILSQLVTDIEDSFVFLGLTDNQEKYLQNMARDAADRAQALYNNAIETDAIMKSLGDGLNATLQQELQGASDASSDNENRIELF